MYYEQLRYSQSYFQLLQQINLKQTVHGAHGRSQIVPQHVVQKHFEHAVEA